MNIRRIKVREFSVFEQTKLTFSSGINVFIGANATGKSHLMKLMYSMLKALEHKVRRGRPKDSRKSLQERLAAVFMPDNDEVGRLVRRVRGRNRAEVELEVDALTWKVALTTLGNVSLSSPHNKLPLKSIFIPSREALAMYDGFIAAYETRELSFDETYYDLCVALSAKPLRGRRTGDMARLLQPLEDILGGSVVLDGGRFYVRSPDGNIEAHLLAEGFRKVAGLAYLIGNGSLMKNSVLFWDEPEANLNPNLIVKIGQALRGLAHGGVQVFMATHDYLLSHELSLAAEYQTRPRVDMRFFAFTRQARGSVQVESGDTLADLANNAILDEFAAHYDRERALFAEAATGQSQRRRQS